MPGVSSQRARRWYSGDAGIALALALIAFLARALFLYRDAMPDPDALMMAAGMAIDLNGDLPRGDALLYGRHVSPGAAFLVRALYPLLFDDARSMVACLNWGTAILSALTASTVFVLARRYLPRAAAVGAAAVWITNAVAWESGTYFHTIVPSTFLLLLAMVLAFRIGASTRGAAWYAATAVCASAAFLVRTEIVFAGPALLVWTFTSPRARRDTLVLASLAAVVVGVYALVLAAIARESTVPSGGFRAYTSWYAASFSPRGMDRTVVWAALSLGVASLAAVAWAGLRRRAPRGQGRLVAFALAWVLPSAIFWMLAPVPVLRHFYLATVGVAWLVGAVVLHDARRAIVLAAAIAALNLALPEAFYAGVRAATGVAKAPHGTFFSAHSYWSRRVAGFVALRERTGACLDASATQSEAAFVTWEAAAHVIYRLGVSGRRVHRIVKEKAGGSVDLVRFDFDGGSLQIIQYIYFDDPAVQERVRAMVDAARARGDCVAVPGRFRDVLGVGAPGPGVIIY